MAISSTISAVTKKFSGKPMGVMAKTLGVASVAAVVYDSHINGKERAASLDEVVSANRFMKQYDQYMTMQKPSATTANLKKWWFETQQSFSYNHLITKTRGYVSAFGSTIARNLPVIALSAIALKCNKLGKVAGALLAVNGLKTLLCDVMGIGSTKPKL